VDAPDVSGAHPRHPPVTFVASHAELGGQERYLRTVIGSLDAAAVAGVVVLHDGPGLPPLAALGYPMRLIPTPARAGMLPAAIRLRRVLLADGARLVHADGVKAALMSVVALWGTGVPVVWMKHDTTLDGPPARWIAARCAVVVGVSSTVTAPLAGVRGTEIRVVPNGVPALDIDRAVARAELRALLSAPDAAELVLQVGRLVSTKGPHETVEAAAFVCARRSAARFAFLGAPDRHTHDYADGLRARVGALGLGDAVTFLGYREDASRLIAGADVLVVPTLGNPGVYGGGEGFGLVAAEAMAAGTPVIAYDEPALPDTLGGCGLLVASGDTRRLGEAIDALLGDPARREQMAGCGRRRARDFTLEASLAELADAYCAASRSRTRTDAGSTRR
jgi:phosphatidylinositol alpha-mannosyltransferase